MPFASANEKTVSEHDNDPDSGRPDNPLFACVIKSTACRETSNYTHLKTNMNYNLGICHTENMWKQLFKWAPRHLKFISTFHGSCNEQDKDCQKKVGEASMEQIAVDVKESIDGQTNCKVKVECSRMEDVDAECYPKWKVVTSSM